MTVRPRCSNVNGTPCSVRHRVLVLHDTAPSRPCGISAPETLKHGLDCRTGSAVSGAMPHTGIVDTRPQYHRSTAPAVRIRRWGADAVPWPIRRNREAMDTGRAGDVRSSYMPGTGAGNSAQCPSVVPCGLHIRSGSGPGAGPRPWWGMQVGSDPATEVGRMFLAWPAGYHSNPSSSTTGTEIGKPNVFEHLPNYSMRSGSVLMMLRHSPSGARLDHVSVPLEGSKLEDGRRASSVAGLTDAGLKPTVPY